MSQPYGLWANIIRNGPSPNLYATIASAILALSTDTANVDTYLPLLQLFSLDQNNQNPSIGTLAITNFTSRFGFEDPAPIQYISSASFRVPLLGRWMRLSNTSGGALTLTSLPTIAAATSDGQYLALTNIGTNTITFQDSGTLSGSGLQLVSSKVTLAQGQTLELRYLTDGGIAKWCQIGSAIPNGIAGVQSIGTAGTQITLPPANDIGWVRLNNTTGGPIILTATPTIPAGTNGQVLELINISSNTISFQDADFHTGSGLFLLTPFATLGIYDSLVLRYSTDAGAWCEDTAGQQASAPDQILSSSSSVISPVTDWIRVNNTSGGTLTLNSAPTVTNGFEGQRIEIFNISANAVALQSASILTNSNLVLSVPVVVLAQGESVALRYSTDAGIGAWCQISENVIVPAFAQCSAYQAGAQAIPTGIVTYTSVQFDTELYDLGGMHSTVTNNSRFTVPTNQAGTYIITAAAGFGGNSSGTVRQARILLDGTTVVASATPLAPSASLAAILTVSTTQELNPGEYIELQVIQDTGSNLSLLATRNSTYLQITRLN